MRITMKLSHQISWNATGLALQDIEVLHHHKLPHSPRFIDLSQIRWFGSLIRSSQIYHSLDLGSFCQRVSGWYWNCSSSCRRGNLPPAFLRRTQRCHFRPNYVGSIGSYCLLELDGRARPFFWQEGGIGNDNVFSYSPTSCPISFLTTLFSMPRVEFFRNFKSEQCYKNCIRHCHFLLVDRLAGPITQGL